MSKIVKEKITADKITVPRETIEKLAQDIKECRLGLINIGPYLPEFEPLANSLKEWSDTLDDLTYYHWVFATKKKGEE